MRPSFEPTVRPDEATWEESELSCPHTLMPNTRARPFPFATWPVPSRSIRREDGCAAGLTARTGLLFGCGGIA
jgi:hypothetical protein